MKLDESEELARNRDLEILTLKDKIKRLNNVLSTAEKNNKFYSNSSILNSTKNESDLEDEHDFNFSAAQQKLRQNDKHMSHSNKKLNVKKTKNINEKALTNYNKAASTTDHLLQFENLFESKESCFNKLKASNANKNQKNLIDDVMSPTTPVTLISDNQNAMVVSIISSTRSVSSTPDDTASLHDGGPPSSSGVSSSGILSSFTGNNDNIKSKSSIVSFEPKSKAELTTWRQCRHKLTACEKRINTLVEVTQRVLNGGRPNKSDILGK